MVDFIAELSQMDDSIPWTVEVDRSNCSTCACIEIKVITPDQRIHEHSIRLSFAGSNNVVEYEPTIHGLKIAKMLGVVNKVKLKTNIS